MKKILDEEVLLRKIETDGFSRNGYPVFQELLVVGKKLKEELGKKRLYDALVDYCEENTIDFNLVLSETMLKKVVSTVMKAPEFRKPDFPIKIGHSEMEKIQEVRDLGIQMVLLSCVTYAGIFGNKCNFSDATKDIRSIINISGERMSVNSFVENVTPIAKTIDLFQHVNSKYHFYRLAEEKDDDVLAIEINSMNELENLTEIYRKFNGGYLAWCKICGDKFLRKSRKDNNKVCQKCGNSGN